jgi:hypothetical protein
VQVRKTFYYVGIYDPRIDISWPYFAEEGRFLSKNRRVCSISKAAEFESPREARLFFAGWKHNAHFKMELVPGQRTVTLPEPNYPPRHPWTILKRIREGESRSCFAQTAREWYDGANMRESLTKSTFSRHWAALLKYGIDISNTPSPESRELLESAKRAMREVAGSEEGALNGRPSLKLVTSA